MRLELEVFRVAPSGAIAPVRRLTLSEVAGGGELTVVGQVGYVSADADGLVVLDFSTPAAPRVVDRLSLFAAAIGQISVDGNRLYPSVA